MSFSVFLNTDKITSVNVQTQILQRDWWGSAYLTGNIPRKVLLWEYLVDFPILYYDHSRTDFVTNQHPVTPHCTNCWSKLHVCLSWEILSTETLLTLLLHFKYNLWQVSVSRGTTPCWTGQRIISCWLFLCLWQCWISDPTMHCSLNDNSIDISNMQHVQSFQVWKYETNVEVP